MNNLNRHINFKKIDAAIKKPPNQYQQQQESPGPNGFSAEFYQNFQEKLISILLKVFHIIET